jgi:hypothetical protein
MCACALVLVRNKPVQMKAERKSKQAHLLHFDFFSK